MNNGWQADLGACSIEYNARTEIKYTIIMIKLQSNHPSASKPFQTEQHTPTGNALFPRIDQHKLNKYLIHQKFDWINKYLTPDYLAIHPKAQPTPKQCHHQGKDCRECEVIKHNKYLKWSEIANPSNIHLRINNAVEVSRNVFRKKHSLHRESDHQLVRRMNRVFVLNNEKGKSRTEQMEKVTGCKSPFHRKESCLKERNMLHIQKPQRMARALTEQAQNFSIIPWSVEECAKQNADPLE